MCYHGKRKELSYAEALDLMEDGYKVRRNGWDKKVEYVTVDGKDIVAKKKGIPGTSAFKVTTKDQLAKDWVYLGYA